MPLPSTSRQKQKQNKRLYILWAGEEQGSGQAEQAFPLSLSSPCFDSTIWHGVTLTLFSRWVGRLETGGAFCLSLYHLLFCFLSSLLPLDTLFQVFHSLPYPTTAIPALHWREGTDACPMPPSYYGDKMTVEVGHSMSPPSLSDKMEQEMDVMT